MGFSMFRTPADLVPCLTASSDAYFDRIAQDMEVMEAIIDEIFGKAFPAIADHAG